MSPSPPTVTAEEDDVAITESENEDTLDAHVTQSDTILVTCKLPTTTTSKQVFGNNSTPMATITFDPEVSLPPQQQCRPPHPVLFRWNLIQLLLPSTFTPLAPITTANFDNPSVVITSQGFELLIQF